MKTIFNGSVVYIFILQIVFITEYKYKHFRLQRIKKHIDCFKYTLFTFILLYSTWCDNK